MLRKPPNFRKNIFINCPFDEEYKRLLRPLLFAVIDCGFRPRIATERNDSSEVRLKKILNLMRDSCYSIHDISRIEPLKQGDDPRFNMPFELGLDIGCKEFGTAHLSKKGYLILEKEKYRYKKVLSDISGNDIAPHNANPEDLVREVRNWIFNIRKAKMLTGTEIWQRYNIFYNDFETALGNDQKEIQKMPINEFIRFIDEWRKSHPS